MNNVIIMGRLTKQPELQYGKSGKEYCKFSIAVDTGWGDNKDTSFFNCMSFGKTADSIVKYFQKGHRILVTGELKQDRWESEGQKRTAVSIIVNRFDFIESKDKTDNVKESFSGEDVHPFKDELPF